MSLEESEDERSGIGSVDDGEGFAYTEEGSETAVSPTMKGIGEEDDVIDNQPHDEAMELDGTSEDSSVASPTSATHVADDLGEVAGEDEMKVENQPFDEAIAISDNESVESEETGSKMSPDHQNLGGATMNSDLETPTRPTMQQSEEESSDSDSEDDADDGGGVEAGQTVFTGVEGGYDPSQFTQLEVSEEIRSLFGYIGRYSPHTIELEAMLQPFIPDYVPAVGDIDAFLKLPRPDGKEDNLGITVLDEPGLHQSDPAALEIQLRHSSKKLNLGEAEVRNIEGAEHNSKAIKAWMDSISEVHKKKPPPEVNYSKVMPDIESLMQVWPPQFEDELSRSKLPSKDLDVSLEDYARIVCALFDIPVHDNGTLTESLHVLFTLYSEFKNNDHFRNEMDAAAGGAFSPMGIGDGMLSPAGYGGPPMSMLDTVGGIQGDPQLMVGGSMLSPMVPQGVYDHEVASMGDDINPPPITFHQR